VKQLLLTTVLAALVVLTGDGRAAGFSRVKCCHGCRSYACNRSNCGTSCKSATRGHGCWKDCGSGCRLRTWALGSWDEGWKRLAAASNGGLFRLARRTVPRLFPTGRDRTIRNITTLLFLLHQPVSPFATRLRRQALAIWLLVVNCLRG